MRIFILLDIVYEVLVNSRKKNQQQHYAYITKSTSSNLSNKVMKKRHVKHHERIHAQTIQHTNYRSIVINSLV